MKFLPVVGWEGIYQVNDGGDVRKRAVRTVLTK